MPVEAPRSLEREAIPCGLAGAKAYERHQISHSAQPRPNRHVSLAGNRPQSLQGVKGCPLSLLVPPQIRVRTTLDSGHDGNGSEHLRFVPKTDVAGIIRSGDAEMLAIRDGLHG